MQETRYFRKKVCLLGDAAVGKTSLIKRYVEDRFDDKYVVTLGTKVTMKEIDIQNPYKDEPLNITMMIWDILGQREYKRLQTSFYRGANGAMVVADVTRKETLDSVHGWILSLFNTVGKVPIIILLNKSDLTDQMAVKPEDMAEFEEKYKTSYLFTSAKTGDNVDLAFKKLSQKLVPKEEDTGSSDDETKTEVSNTNNDSKDQVPSKPATSIKIEEEDD